MGRLCVEKPRDQHAHVDVTASLYLRVDTRRRPVTNKRPDLYPSFLQRLLSDGTTCSVDVLFSGGSADMDGNTQFSSARKGLLHAHVPPPNLVVLVNRFVVVDENRLAGKSCNVLWCHHDVVSSDDDPALSADEISFSSFNVVALLAVARAVVPNTSGCS